MPWSPVARRSRTRRARALLEPRLCDVRLLHRPVLVRPGRLQPAWPAEHGLRVRLVRLRRGARPRTGRVPYAGRGLKRPRSAAVAGRRQHVHRPHRGCFVDDEATGPPPGPARPDHRSGEPAAVLRGLGRRADALRRDAPEHLLALRRPRSDRGRSDSLQAAAVGSAGQLSEPQPGAADAAVPELVGEPAQLEEHPGRNAGQRNVRDARLGLELAADDLRRRRPLGLRRDERSLPVPHLLLAAAGSQLPRRRTVVLELHRRPAVRGVGPVLLPDHLRPGGLGNVVLGPQPRLAHAGRRWPAGVPRAALQRVHR